MPAVPLTQVAVHLRPEDNIAVAARNLPLGLEVMFDESTLRLAEGIRLGHKLALRAIRKAVSS